MKIMEIRMYMHPVYDIHNSFTVEVETDTGHKFSRRIEVQQNDSISQIDLWMDKIKHEFKQLAEDEAEYLNKDNWRELK